MPSYISCIDFASKQTIEIDTSMSSLRFGDLIDVDEGDRHNQYVMMYNSATRKYEMVNPDKVLSASSSTETTQPGLPSDFKNVLDVDMDNRIDLDAGQF